MLSKNDERTACPRIAMLIIVLIFAGISTIDIAVKEELSIQSLTGSPLRKEEDDHAKKSSTVDSTLQNIPVFTAAPSLSMPFDTPIVANRKRHLDRFISENTGKAVLIVQADNRRLRANAPIIKSYAHSSIVAFNLWAHKNNYSHVWVTGTTAGPYGKQVASYWNKVPASMLALKLARRASIPFVVMVDSDALPTDIFLEKDCELESMLERHQAHLIVSPDHQFYQMVNKGFKLYSKAINSGVIMFDTSEESEQLLKHWWEITTNQTTPFEEARSSLLVTSRYTSKSPDEVKLIELLDRPNDTDVLVKFNQLCNLTHIITENSFKIEPDGSVEWTIEVELTFDGKQNWSKATRTSVAEMQESCCGGNKTCSRFVALKNSENEFPDTEIEVNVTCKMTPFSTLVHWPGEQDRLNWIMDKVFNRSKVVNDLGICGTDKFDPKLDKYCFQHFCNTKSGYLGNKAFEYLVSGRANQPSLVNITRDEFNFVVGHEQLSRTWKLKTTTAAMDIETGMDDDVFDFED